MKKHISSFAFFIFLSFTLSISSPSQGEEKKVMSFVTAAPITSDLAKITTKVLTEAFKRLGYEYEVNSVPQKRGIALMSQGVVDGDATRVFKFNSKNEFPAYIRVNESHAKIFWSVFTTKPEFKVTSWQDLKTSGYKIGYLAGVKYSEANLIGLIDPEKLIPQPSSNLNGLVQLKYGRIDAYVYADSSRAKNDFANELLADTEIHMAGHVGNIQMYPYLNTKHAKLAEPLAQKIREIKAEGLYDSYLAQLIH